MAYRFLEILARAEAEGTPPIFFYSDGLSVDKLTIDR